MTKGSKVLIYLTLLCFLLHYLQKYSKIRSLSRRFSVLPCNISHHTFLLQSKTKLQESNIQQDNFHFYIDFSYSDKIHYHMYIGIVLVYYSRDHECHKIPENIKHNLGGKYLLFLSSCSVK